MTLPAPRRINILLRAFRALMSGDGRAQEHAAKINRLEDAADQVTRATVLAIHRSFITPFDRS